jgi:hypothetical protein
MKSPAFKKFAPIFIGIGISGLLMVFGFKILTGVASRASGIAPVPGSVSVNNIADNSATIVWTTDIDTQCVIEYNSSLAAVASGSFAPEIQKTSKHSVDLTLLAPDTTYYYDISCENKKFDNDGAPFSFKTLATKGKGTVPSVTAVPSAAPSSTIPTLIPTVVPTIAGSGTCTATTCADMKNQIGKGCTMQEYLRKCINSSPTPTLQVAPKITTAPTGSI